MDGSYAQETDAGEALTTWHERRPRYEHVLTHEDKWYLPDNIYLPVQYWLERENEQKELKEFKDFKEFKEFKAFKKQKGQKALKEFEDFKELKKQKVCKSDS